LRRGLLAMCLENNYIAAKDFTQLSAAFHNAVISFR